MKRPILSSLSLLFVILSGIIFFFHHQPTQESIIYFPIAENVYFKEANTNLTLEEKKDIGKYKVKWSVSSLLDRNAYLRQDISFLFANGRLKATMSDWKEHNARITQNKDIFGEDSSYLNSISYHYAELHENKESFKSSQQMSSDELYIIDSLFSPLQSFRLPKTNVQSDWKQTLDRTTELQLQYSWNKLIDHFKISRDTYTFLPMTDLVKYNDKPLPGLNKKETQKIIGNLWEGLYKNYFLGIKKNNGSMIEPLDSTIPLIGISKDLSHLIVLIEAKDGTPIKLIQSLQFRD